MFPLVSSQSNTCIDVLGKGLGWPGDCSFIASRSEGRAKVLGAVDLARPFRAFGIPAGERPWVEVFERACEILCCFIATLK